jgi:hypothetical protein
MPQSVFICLVLAQRSWFDRLICDCEMRKPRFSGLPEKWHFFSEDSSAVIALNWGMLIAQLKRFFP